MTTATVARRSFSAMSCTASLVVCSDDRTCRAESLADLAVGRVAELEARWSRFLPGSEVTCLNVHAGAAVAVSADTLTLVEAMVRGWHATEHSYDPTLLATLLDLGYVSSRRDSTLTTVRPTHASRQGDPSTIGVDRVASVAMLPAGMAIDPGGIGKGLAADLVVGELLAQGASGALVEIGGDLGVAGAPPPDESSWTIAVDGVDDGALVVQQGGIATSTTRRRRWRADDELRHHLIDPLTLMPSANGCTSCTVIAGTAAWAEVFTKVAFARPLDTALAIFEHRSLAASLTTDDGQRHVTSAWKGFAR